MARWISALALICASACGHGSSAPPPPPPPDDAARSDVAPLELPAQPLGLATLDAFAWRKRAGQPAFRAARKAENREDWPAVAASCRDALAADPTHLEAAWLDAVALAKTGHLDGVLAPLAVAGTGDYGKWAFASLEQPALQPWLATPSGEAWRRRVDDDRADYLAALGRALVVSSHGDLFGFDPEARRFLRLTRTYGGVIGAFAMRQDHRIAYVTHGKDGKLGVGLVNLTTGRTSHPTKLTTGPLRLAANPKGVSVRIGTAWQLLDDDGKLHALARAPKPAEWLDVKGRTARLVKKPPDGILGDFDDQGLASAIRIALTNKTITVPGQIDGATIAWSSDRGHLAFVAQLDNPQSCTKPDAMTAAAFVVDPSTGHVDELARATGGLAIAWVGDRQLAIAGDQGVELEQLAGKPEPIALADGLLSPRRRPRCAPDEPAGSDVDVDDVGDEGSDVPATP